MKYILKNRQINILILFFLVVAIFFSVSIDSDFFNMYIRNYNIISIRYFFLSISVVIEYIVHCFFNSSIIVNRYKNRTKYFNHIIFTEIFLSFYLFSFFNTIIFLSKISISFDSIPVILITLINLLIIYITISLFIKLIDLFIKNHIISCAMFIFLFACFDFILDYFNFFFYNNSLISLSNIYTIYYSYSRYGLYTCIIFIILFDFFLFNILNLGISKKDFIIQGNDENE